MLDIRPKYGERALIAGQTGCGKTAFARFMLERVEMTPFIIYDTKDEPKFNALPASIVAHDLESVTEAIDDEKIDFVIFRPSEEIIADKLALDELLWHHYRRFHHVGAYIDEITEFSNGGKAEKGLKSILSRGRSKGITCIMSTQRPKWLARDCITESRNFYLFDVIDRQDRKRFDDIIEDFSELPRPVKHGFYFMRIGDMDSPKEFAPIKLDDKQNSGYVDIVQSGDEQPTAHKPDIWI